MWALRRSSIQLRNRGLSSASARILDVNYRTGSGYPENCDLTTIQPQGKRFYGELSLTRSYNMSSNSSKLHLGIGAFSSRAGAKDTTEEDDDLEDAFSELEAPIGNNDDSLALSDLSENEDGAENLHNVLDSILSERKYLSAHDVDTSAMTKALLAAPQYSVSKVMDKWVEEGNEVTAEEAMLSMSYLRRRRLFATALQLSEWLEATKTIDFTEIHYASRIDLIAKVGGLSKAEEYLETVPESFKGELVYTTLLTNCVSKANTKRSENLFHKMRGLGVPVTCYAFNQMIRLYKMTARKKIAGVLLLMEKENIKPSISTYQLLIDATGAAKDITGMEKIVETMKSEGVEPSPNIKATMARHYAASGYKDKAEALLKEIEEGMALEENRWACRMLLPLYASLGKEEEVARIWKICESETRFLECVAAIGAWGQLGKIEKAESAFERAVQKAHKPSTKLYTAMLYVYANHKMLTKGKDLMRRMVERGCTVGPRTWDALVKLYVASGEVEKANALLKKALEQRRGKSKTRIWFSTYFTILIEFAKRGDVRSAEDIFDKTRRAGHVSTLRLYESLLRAYLNAKAPAYGFRERMKADNLLPNRFIMDLLDQVDAFKNSTAVDLLE